MMNAVEKIAREAGKMALSFLRQHKDLNIEKKQDKSLVTDADKLVNTFILKELQSKYQDIKVIGEESNNESLNELIDFGKGQYFFVDPIDGTNEFIKNNGEWCQMIGLLEGELLSSLTLSL